MLKQFVLISLFFVPAAIAGQNTNSSTTMRPRSTPSPKPTETRKNTDTQKPTMPQPAARPSPAKPKVVVAPAPASGGVVAAFEALINGIRKTNVKAVSSVYWNSPGLILFNNNGTVTKGWEQMRSNRESSYPDLKDVNLEIRDLSVMMLGRDGAVVTCLWTQSQKYKEAPETASGRMTLVFKRFGKDWKAVHLHTSPDKEDPTRVLPSEQTPPPTSSPTPFPTPSPKPSPTPSPKSSPTPNE